MENNKGTILISFLAGAVVGAGLGILFAPYKGSKIRGKIKHGIVDTAHDLSERLKQAKEELTKSANDKKEAFDNQLEVAISKMSYKAEDMINALEDKLEDLKKKNAHLQK